jgi:hypothetical protein
MSNFTYVDDNAFDNLDATEVSGSESVTSIIRTVWLVTSEIIKLLISCSSAGASIFLIYIISKFDNIRRSNHIIILHYAIACLVDMLLVPLLVFLNEVTMAHTWMRWELICLLHIFNSSSCFLLLVFAASIGIYWFIENVKKTWVEKFTHFRIYFILTLYVIFFIKLLIFSTECFFYTVLTNIILVVVYCILLLIIIIINVGVKWMDLNEDQLNTKYLLTVSTYVTCSYLPLLTLSFMQHFEMPDVVDYVMGFAYYFAEYFAFSGIIVVTYLLGKKNEHFKEAYNKLFKRSAQRYDGNMLNDEWEEAAEAPNQGVQL